MFPRSNSAICWTTSTAKKLRVLRSLPRFASVGEDPPAKAEDDVEKFVQRFIGRLAKTINQLNESFPEAEQQKQARDLLATGLQQVLDSIQS